MLEYGSPEGQEGPAKSDPFLQALEEALGPRAFSVTRLDRQISARDLWPLLTLRTLRGHLTPLPRVVVWPSSEDEVVKIVAIARAHQVPITPYGGGSGVLGGASAGPGGLVLDLKRLDGVLDLNPQNGTCTVGPGILGQPLEDLLRARGFTLGHFPSSLMTASVGGYVATRSAGQFSSRYGKIEDMVQSLRLVAGTGEILDTSREGLAVHLPELVQLLVGSEGTLGIITQVTLRIHPAPATARYRGVRFRSLEHGLQAMRRILQAGLRPSVLRLYDELDTLIVGRGDKPLDAAVSTLPPTHHGSTVPSGEGRAAEASVLEREEAPRDLGRRFRSGVRSLLDRYPEVTRSAVRLAMGRPALLENLVERLVPHELLLVMGTEGEPEEVEATLSAMLELCQASGGQDLGPEPGERWLKKRYDVSYKMPRFLYHGVFVDTIEVAATWDRIPALYHAVRQAVSDEVVIMAHFSHAYPEGLSIYFSLSGLAETLEDAEQRYQRAWSLALEAALEQGATVSHHHGAGIHKARFCAREHADFVSLWKALKARLDPDAILNPGRLYRGADIENTELPHRSR